MTTIRELFDPQKPIDRRIEKVITYETASEALLKQEVREYVATESIELHFDRLLDQLEYGMGGGDIAEIGVWVSGFYGSGKSSFTKYLGFALDPDRRIEGKPFLKWLQNQLNSNPLRTRLETAAKKHAAAVIMLDLAGEQLAGAAMAEISTVLYAKVMQWAGYSRDAKVAYLEFMLEKDGRMDDFRKRITELAKGKTWDDIRNQPLAVKALASRTAAEFYPDLFPDMKTFNDIRIEELIKEDDRVRQMFDLIRRKTGRENMIFILDEVGQYVAARDDLILNLDGLAKNIKNIGGGRAWIIATAQQTLTEDDPRHAANTAKLFKLKDRFPVTINLEASDIKEICYNRLLGKSPAGKTALVDMFDRHGPQLRHATELKETGYYKSTLDKDVFCRLYPFLPHHFEILLQLLSRLARTRGGIGLRSAIKVIQDILVDPGGARKGAGLLADAPAGTLAAAPVFYDTLKSDIEKPFPFIINGVRRAETVYGEDSGQVRAAKTVAVLQILEDFPVSRENIAAMMHPAVDSASLRDSVGKAVADMLDNPEIPMNEVDGGLRFMSEAVMDLEKARLKIDCYQRDINHLRNAILKDILATAPAVQLMNTRSVKSGYKVRAGSISASLAGDKEPVQTLIDFVPPAAYESRKQELFPESQQRVNLNTIFLTGVEDGAVEADLIEIHRCREIEKQHRGKRLDKDVEDYLRAQKQRADRLAAKTENSLKKSLLAGSFIFRGKHRSVKETGESLHEALKTHLSGAAEEVFDKYAEAPVPADSITAEKFLKIETLSQIPEKHDPLHLVKRGAAKTPIDIDHKAVVSIRNYLETRGQVDGRKLLDDFYAPPFGWSKDATRYITAAMLVAGVVKLRIGGDDVTVRGDAAVNGLKNTNSFNKIGIALRDGRPDPEALLRARERLLELTGDDVMPLEEEISKCVMRRFPDFQQDYAPLAVQIKNLGLQGEDRAQSVQDNLAELLKGDASDAAGRLGGEDCPLFDDLAWAREVKKAFDNGMGDIIRTAREFMAEIPKLPRAGAIANLIDDTEPDREALAGYIGQDDFYASLPAIRNRIDEIRSKVEQSAGVFLEEVSQKLNTDKKRLQNRPDWGLLSAEDKNRLGEAMDGWTIRSEKDLNGLKKVINEAYCLNGKISETESEIKTLAEKNKIPGGGGVPAEIILETPAVITSPGELDELIKRLEDLKNQLESGKIIRMVWR